MQGKVTNKGDIGGRRYQIFSENLLVLVAKVTWPVLTTKKDSPTWYERNIKTNL